MGLLDRDSEVEEEEVEEEVGGGKEKGRIDLDGMEGNEGWEWAGIGLWFFMVGGRFVMCG